MSGINNFSEEGQGKIHHVVSAEEKVAPSPKKKIVPSEKVKPSEGVKKVTTILNDREEPVPTISRKYLDNFQGKYKALAGWFNLDHKWLKRRFPTIELDFYNFFEKMIEGQDIKTYITL